MKKSILNTTLLAALMFSFVACKNNNATTETAATTTTTSTTTTTTAEPSKTNTDANMSEQDKAMSEAAQKMCSCEGVKNYFAKLKTFDGKTEAEVAKAALEFAPLRKPFEQCTKSIKTEIETKYPNLAKDKGDQMQKFMVKTCSDIMPQRMIDKVNAAN
jgi:hypothetical protein